IPGLDVGRDSAIGPGPGPSNKKKNDGGYKPADTPTIDLPEIHISRNNHVATKEAARTCILSKSWLQAWSTIPTLRFPCHSLTSYNKLIDSTLVSLLEKINLIYCEGFKTIKLKNLRCLRELEISSIEQNDILEIDDVPSLGFFRYTDYLNKPLPFNMDSLGSVTHLDISGVVLDNAFFDMIKSNFPFLESLSLVIISRGLESIVITSLPLKRLTLEFWVDIRTIDVQVYAPKESTQFIKQFDIDIEDSSHHALVSSKTKVDDLRRRVSFPVTNVQQLSVTTFSMNATEGGGRALFFDAFFSICHPSYVKLKGNKCFTKMMVKEMMKKKTTDLKDVAFKNPRNGKWEDLTKSSTSLLADVFVDFKLNWFSHHGPSGPENK
ncbi:F-box protein-like protein, partial [Tanacetum coccineum]